MFWLWSPCFEHQNHLIVGGGLRLTDKLLKQRGAQWKYFSALAKMCHLWRDHAKDVHKLWVNQFGALDAAKHVKTLIPQCKGGRWASVEGVEKRIDDAGEAKLGQLLKAAILKGKAGALPLADDEEGAAEVVPAEHIDQVHVDAVAHYSQMMSLETRCSDHNV